jgi:hypothetical protein
VFAEDPCAGVDLGPGEERIEDPRYVVTFTPGMHFWSVSVCRIRCETQALGATVAQIRSLIEGRGRRAAAWTVGESAMPTDLPERLGGLGLRVEGRYEVLVLTHPPRRGPAPGFEVRTVQTRADLLTAIGVTARAFAWPAHDEDDERTRVSATLDAARAGHASRLLAFDAGRAIATGQAWASPWGLFLGGGATLPTDRGRGAMTSLLGAAWEEAVRRGTPALATHGGELSSPILSGLGFEKVGEVTHFIDVLSRNVDPPSPTPAKDGT